jgi:ubiquinone/menaquinone biosynthesis C-methylase UbiE
MTSFKQRARQDELMDDLSRPEKEFDEAYRELKIINRYLGGMRAIERCLPSGANALVLDVAAGACDISEALAARTSCRFVVLDLNSSGLKRARRSMPVAADALNLPFSDGTFDIVTASLFFHHLSNEQCEQVLAGMWRVTKRMVVVNDLHRHRAAYWSIRALTTLFSDSAMVRHDGPLSVRRAFRPSELLAVARAAGVPARVFRSFPYRLVMVAEK